MRNGSGIEVKAAAAQGYDWRSVIDSLRPITSQLWQKLLPREQKRFLWHMKSYWEVHRHRIAPEIHHVLQEMLNSGQLAISVGQIRAYQSTTDTVSTTVCDRDTKTDVAPCYLHFLTSADPTNLDANGIHLEMVNAKSRILSHVSAALPAECR